MLRLRFYFFGKKRDLLSLNWFMQTQPDIKLIDCRPIEVR